MAKIVLRGNFIGLSTFIREQSLKINELSIQIKKLEENPHQTQINKKKKIIKVEIIRLENYKNKIKN